MQVNQAISVTLLITAILTIQYFPLYPLFTSGSPGEERRPVAEKTEQVKITLPLKGRARWEFEDALVACLARQRAGAYLPRHALKAMANEFTYRLNKHRDLRKAVSYDAYKETYPGLQKRLVSLSVASGAGRNADDLRAERGALYALYRYMNAVGYGCAVHELSRRKQDKREKKQ